MRFNWIRNNKKYFFSSVGIWDSAWIKEFRIFFFLFSNIIFVFSINVMEVGWVHIAYWNGYWVRKMYKDIQNEAHQCNEIEFMPFVVFYWCFCFCHLFCAHWMQIEKKPERERKKEHSYDNETGVFTVEQLL